MNESYDGELEPPRPTPALATAPRHNRPTCIDVHTNRCLLTTWKYQFTLGVTVSPQAQPARAPVRLE